MTLRIIVAEEEAGLRPDRLLRRRYPDVAREHALKLLKAGRITIAGAACRLSTAVTPGQVLRVAMSREAAGPATGGGVTVIFEAEGICAVDKPADLAMHTGTGVLDDAATLRGWLERHLEVEDGFSGPSFLGRLDRPTSGLVIAALSRAGLAAVGPSWRAGKIEKAYLVVVHGRTPEGGVIDIPLAARRPRHRGSGRREEATTRFLALSRQRAGSLLIAFPETGRTHQIRRHMKAIGHPVVGDARYGDVRRDRDLESAGLMLHCYRYRHDGDVPVLPRELVAPLPERMRAVCERLDIRVDSGLKLAEGLGPPATPLEKSP